MLKHSFNRSSSLPPGDQDSDSGSSSSGEEEVGQSKSEEEEARRVWEHHTVPRERDTEKWVGMGPDTSGMVMEEVKVVSAGLGREQQMSLGLVLGLLLFLGLVLYSVLLHFAIQASRCPV